MGESKKIIVLPECGALEALILELFTKLSEVNEAGFTSAATARLKCAVGEVFKKYGLEEISGDFCDFLESADVGDWDWDYIGMWEWWQEKIKGFFYNNYIIWEPGEPGSY